MFEENEKKTQNEFFKLKPIKVAKVSEISELVSSSSVKVKERVNFHIGNPVSSTSLNLKYTKSIFAGGEEDCKKEYVDLIKKAIKECVPYAKRGGFDRRNPNDLANYVYNWFKNGQLESLEYDLGSDSCKREIIFNSGGLPETLRVFFHAISNYMCFLPVHIITRNFSIPSFLSEKYGLPCIDFDNLNSYWLESLTEYAKTNKMSQMIVFIGEILKESERRALREICLKFPVIVVEVNNAPNHLSMAREAGCINKVIRFLTFNAINQQLSNLSTVIVAGNYQLLSMMETVHFELKGTPANSEILLTNFLLNNLTLNQTKENKNPEIFELVGNKSFAVNVTNFRNNYIYDKEFIFSEQKNNLLRNSEKVFEKYYKKVNLQLDKFEDNLSVIVNKFIEFEDPFVSNSVDELIHSFFAKVKEKKYQIDLEKALIASFCKVHPKYSPLNCFVVSGSSRTALSILGYHCGISEVIMPDLGWTYHHCFEKVTAVSLHDDLSLNIEAIVEMVTSKIEQNANWKEYGAVILNNPHNASGKVFDAKTVKSLLKQLLSQKIMVIDDLSYENIHPRPDLNGVPTLKQLVNELVANGELKESDKQYIITVHSLSKTDCFAGARLAVVEILNSKLHDKFLAINMVIEKNVFAIFIAYLFYRRGKENVREFWLLRNSIFHKRMSALTEAIEAFPKERNLYNIKIIPPAGSMYPRLEIDNLPKGISLNWLSSGLAVRGIGMVPLSTFSQTEKGFELGRKTFRLTLGGTDSADLLLVKSRKVLIELNKLIARESINYNQFSLVKEAEEIAKIDKINQIQETVERKIICNTNLLLKKSKLTFKQLEWNSEELQKSWSEYLSYRIKAINRHIKEKLVLKEKQIKSVRQDDGERLFNTLEKEFHKDSLCGREQKFQQRLYDRTVHPTQMYSLKTDTLIYKLILQLAESGEIDSTLIENLAKHMILEFVGKTVPISSQEEGAEVLCDLNSLINAEQWAFWMNDTNIDVFLSFWSDWDGSTRPSGQGHRLVSAVLIENIKNLIKLVELLNEKCENIEISPLLMKDISLFHNNKVKFKNLLNDITVLTQKLEKKYQGIFPKDLKIGILRRMAISLNLMSDPIDVISEHNNRLERKMELLRTKRRKQLEYYFGLNKKLRKILYSHLEQIKRCLNDDEILFQFASYRDLLKRFVLTPRIHQKTIETIDPFTINTTIHNIMEINDISGKFGNPAMVMGLQISMSSVSSALTNLDRKFREKRKERKSTVHLPMIKIIPLFEEKEAVVNIKSYLDELWEYARIVKNMDQTVEDRFLEVVCELFIAGSDLSQQLSQLTGAYLYKRGKYDVISWLATKGLADKVRIKLGSGEPMQRQGGYYDCHSGQQTLSVLDENDKQYRLNKYLPDSARKSMYYAKSPLSGIMVGGEFRTFQSNVSEKMRHISDEERAQLLFHIYNSQKNIKEIIAKSVEPMVQTRLETKEKGQKELRRIVFGDDNELMIKFVSLTEKTFRQILFGSKSDLVGIHVISYFISRTTPTLRDRPVVRPGRNIKTKQTNEMVDKLKEIVPLSNYGSMLRAIGHNRAQTVVLGVNQLTTGLFRCFSEILSNYSNAEEGKMVISEQILPLIPVKETLHTLRIYHDINLSYVREFEGIFPSGNSVFHLLREDNIAITRFCGILQKELIRRQGLEPCDFFDGEKFKNQLLPLFRPDLAVLLQENIFNVEIKTITKDFKKEVPKLWISEMKKLLEIPIQIKMYRAKIWNLILIPIKNQVSSFVKLAGAINSVSKEKINFNNESINKVFFQNISTKVFDVLKKEEDEKMKQFLFNAIYYLSSTVASNQAVPIEVLKVLKDVKQIVKLEEQALDKNQQELFKFYFLTIARITGENG